MNYRRELATTEFCEEIKPLVLKHYKEIAHYQDIALDPDFNAYVELEGKGMIRVFTVRDDSKVLRGYAIFFVRANLHYRSSIQAIQDILYIDPNHRNAGFGGKFISFCDEELKKESVQAVYHHVKQAHNFGPLLEKIGYQLVDLIYARRLDKETS